MGGRPWSTVWGTLHEPRVVTAAQVTAYALLAATGALVLTAAHLDADVALGAVLMILGGAVGIPSAWRGGGGGEAPAAALAALGLVLVTVADLLRGPGGHWGAWPAPLACYAVVALVQRVLRTWGRTWAPGREPDTRLRRVQTALRVERVLEADAVARAQERGGEEAGCGT